ncbi:MAG: phosphatase PAP2 family protein [Anaerolineales bacterium]|jgi:membrane-associated phospholipid phosphatase
MTDNVQESKNPFSLQRTVLIIQMIMIAVMSGFIFSRGKVPGLDMAGLILLTLLLWMLRDRFSWLDFAPFLLMLCTYEVIRSVIQAVGTDGVHVMDLIAWERTLCAGIIPSSVLQQAWGTTAYAGFLDVVANSFYMTHFFSVILMGIVLWVRRRPQYGIFVVGLTALSYAGFLTYVVFPAAPPWWASMNGYLGEEAVGLSHSLLSPEHIFATANPLGAMPSLHTAWPMYLLLFALDEWGRKALPVAVLPIGVAVASIYLGHHYLIDILAGIGCAAVAFGMVKLWSRFRLGIRESVGRLATA